MDQTQPPAAPSPGRSRRAATAAAGITTRTGRAVARKVDEFISARGQGFRSLAISFAGSTAGDTLIVASLASALFLGVPSTEARSNVILYLLLTLAPFAVVGPALGMLFLRYPIAYRAGLGLSAYARAAVALIMLTQLPDSPLLFPLAFFLLVFSRIHGISRNSLVPAALDERTALVEANARLAKVGVVVGTIAAPVGVLLEKLPTGAAIPLLLATGAFLVSAAAARRVPYPARPPARPAPATRPRPALSARRLLRTGHLPRAVRLAEAATAGVRLINGFLLLLLAFEFRDQDAGILDFGALLGAAGLGFFLAALVSPWLARVMQREEPMVVAALALEAAAAFIGTQAFGLWAAAALAAAAGLAWGVAKFGFDGMLQNSVDAASRGRAFVRTETVFQLAWVVGALVPSLITIPATVGLAVAGVMALSAQVLYVAGLLAPDPTPEPPGAGSSDESLPPLPPPWEAPAERQPPPT